MVFNLASVVSSHTTTTNGEEQEQPTKWWGCWKFCCSRLERCCGKDLVGKIYKIFAGFLKNRKKTLEATLFARRLFFLDDGEMGSLNCHDVSNNRDALEESKRYKTIV